jgi:hypothetical protein
VEPDGNILAGGNKFIHAIYHADTLLGLLDSEDPDWPWGSPSLLYNGYWVSFPDAKWQSHGIDHPPPSRIEERVELYPYPPSGPSWPVLG